MWCVFVTEQDLQINTFSKLVEVFLVLPEKAQSNLQYYNHRCIAMSLHCIKHFCL